MVILHGLLGCGDNWVPVAKALAACHHVLVPDQRNHGRSPHSDAFNHELLAQDLEELLDRFDLATATVIGHSMGGKTAMQFALTRPARVEKLIVVDIAPRRYRNDRMDVLNALNSIQPARYSRRGDIDHILAAHVPEQATRAFLLKNLGRDSSGALSWRPNLASLRDNVERILEAQDIPSSFVGPTLVLRGGASAYVSETDTADIATLFPSARVHTIPRAGHWVHADAPADFLTVVNDFLG
ncbi:MAG: alpha/beta fold hydrolase [Lentisphaerae bacterium]|nr:alpha/beta fold hydrolase [Lentisphaerota bacterium]MBT5608142.1 alpha/beta fold hydrolase [Lentisphaerota bacterium]MBT7060581.1 alpha/beta fold hydrolase [Lentisphaerota bacterium]MBT7847680.1 alpha/beta fold hydrolase [Lentisphaerota bacterium]